jgi:hypothetical protein
MFSLVRSPDGVVVRDCGASFPASTFFFAVSRSASLGVPQTTRLGFCLRISRSSSTEARERRRLLRLWTSSGWSWSVKRPMKASACLRVAARLTRI